MKYTLLSDKISFYSDKSNIQEINIPSKTLENDVNILSEIPHASKEEINFEFLGNKRNYSFNTSKNTNLESLNSIDYKEFLFQTGEKGEVSAIVSYCVQENLR